MRYHHFVNGTAVVHGNGVTAACCVQALAANSTGVTVSEKLALARESAVLLSESTQALLGDLFRKPALLDHVPTIRKRIVAWGDRADSIALPHAALMISEQDLLALLTEVPQPVLCDGTKSEWDVFCSRDVAPRDAAVSWGSRTAAFSRVRLTADADDTACWMESVEDGWLFLFTAAEGTGWLIACGQPVDRLLGQSRVIGAQIDSVIASSAPILTAPRIRDCLGGPGWLTCGSAAILFDPICGEGTGNAIREALLASAVIEAASRGEDVTALLQHYQSRLTLGFLRHLHTCAQFYSTGGTGAFWQEQLHSTQLGIAAISRRVQEQSPPVFRLRDLQMERI